MKKFRFYVVLLVVILASFILTETLIINNNKKKDKEKLAKNVSNEYYLEELNEIVSVTSEVEKITPNTSFVIKKEYSECGHIIKEEVEIPRECINKTKNELEQEYTGWNIENFSNDEVIISKKENGYCDKHYILREREGIVAIYALDRDGKEVFKEDTSIGIEYLTETDSLSIRQGMQIYGDEKLNSFLEDFE